jgi:hypothetical protein
MAALVAAIHGLLPSALFVTLSVIPAGVDNDRCGDPIDVMAGLAGPYMSLFKNRKVVDGRHRSGHDRRVGFNAAWYYILAQLR